VRAALAVTNNRHNGRLDESLADALLSDVAAVLRRYVVLSDVQLVALALWVLHTHAIAGAYTTPYVSITSAEKACGKTRLLEVLEVLVARPWFTARTTAAALTRKIEAEQPTLLLDESDAAFKSDKEYAEGLRGLLNSGYRRGGKTTVCVGHSANIKTRDFSTFSAKAIAGIGELPDTVASRSIPVRLKRRAPDEQIARWKGHRRVDQDAASLRQRLEAWASANTNTLDTAEPEPVEQLGDRAAECWEPLLAIADLAAGDWPQRARSAALVLSAGEATDETSHGVLLLAAMRHAIGDRANIATDELLTAINVNAELPFGGWHDGRGVGPHFLAKHLGAYKIKPKSIRVGDKTPRGYAREDCEDAWSRYLRPSPERPPQAQQPQQATDPPHTSPRKHGDVADVADVAPSADVGPRKPVCAYPAHADDWRPHPATGLVVCWVCHTPGIVLRGLRTAHDTENAA
jgi:hypothetical protein